VLDQLEREGTLGRRNFGHGDELEHWWFRARMVERLTTHAAHRVVLPRPGGVDELRRHFGAEAATALERAVVVPEGIDERPAARAEAAVRAAATGAPEPPGAGPLLAALAELEPARRGRPLIVSVGRLHPNKGMPRLAEAWMTDPVLRSETNLVIVGGDLDRPSADELDVLTDLDAILGDAAARRRRGAVLLGHQPNAIVAHVLALAAAGRPGVVGAGGIYVAAAAKEEFGLAIVEALRAGLPVVAPAVGGPPTYVADGDTGVLADTSRVDALREAMARARTLVERPGRAERARALVRERLNVDAMAGALVAVYDLARVTGP
jgi:glycosyltransferase involved in cell wall biosynthesis